MARGGLYKTDIQKARDVLVAQGTKPTVDALRVALGNTGSKTTIHRYLKELEAEEGGAVGAKLAISDTLQDLVGRLAARLHEEADARIQDAQTRFEAQRSDNQAALDRQTQEIAGLSAQLQRTEVALQTEQTSHADTRLALQDSRVAASQLEERVAGLTTRVAEHDKHAQSLEQKHQQAREALEHFRTSSKEQRDQEQRRHEHQVQTLQVELRQANEALTGKNHELLQINREAGRLTEQLSQVQKDLRQAQSDGRRHQQELDTLRPLPNEVRALQLRWTQEAQLAEQLRRDITEKEAAVNCERINRVASETELTRVQARLEALETLWAHLEVGVVRAKEGPMQASSA